jgi:hypothetical protein
MTMRPQVARRSGEASETRAQGMPKAANGSLES